MALLQNCHIDRKTLSICISLIERGVNPEALAVRLSPVLSRPLQGQHPWAFPADRPNANGYSALQQVVKDLRQEAELIEQEYEQEYEDQQ